VTSILVFLIIIIVALITLVLPINIVFTRLTKVLIKGVIKDRLISRALQAVISRGNKALGIYSLKLVGLDVTGLVPLRSSPRDNPLYIVSPASQNLY
jgi:hypothetical protein